MQKLLKTTPFHRLALASAAALSMAGVGVAAAQDSADASVTTWQERCEAGFSGGGGEVTSAAFERVKPSCEGPQANSRAQVHAEAVADQPVPAAAPVGGEAGALPERLDRRADVTEDVSPQPLSREEVYEEAVRQQRQNPNAGEGEAGDLRQRLDERADLTSSLADDDAALQALRDASARADDGSTGAFVVQTDEGPMLLIVTDDAQAPYTLVALEEAVLMPVQ